MSDHDQNTVEASSQPARRAPNRSEWNPGRLLHDPFIAVMLLSGFAGFVLLMLISGNTVLTWAVFAASSILLISEILTRQLPNSIRQRCFENCIRSDGTWSRGRAAVERHSLARFRINVIYALLLAMVPTLFGLWWLNREVIPIGIGVDVLSSIVSDPDEWRNSVQDEEIRFANWQRDSEIANSMGAEEHKQAVWHAWPALMGLCIIWGVASLAFVANYYLYCVRKLRDSVHARNREYRQRALAREQVRLQEASTVSLSDTAATHA